MCNEEYWPGLKIDPKVIFNIECRDQKSWNSNPGSFFNSLKIFENSVDIDTLKIDPVENRLPLQSRTELLYMVKVYMYLTENFRLKSKKSFILFADCKRENFQFHCLMQEVLSDIIGVG